MKRWGIWLGVLALVLSVVWEEGPGTEVAKLEPVRLLKVDAGPGWVSVASDLGHFGFGGDLEKAIGDMELTAVGQVFLDTAEYLLVTPEAQSHIPELARILRPNCRLCLDGGTEDLPLAAEYLEVHRPECALGRYARWDRSPQTLYSRGERLYLARP